MPQFQRTGTVLKKCSCPAKTRCAHGWTLRYWLDGRQRERTFRDTPGKPGSGRKLAEDYALKLAHDKRSGDAVFHDQSRGAVRFADYCAEWINGPRRESTRGTYRSYLKRMLPVLGNRTLAQVAGDREAAQQMIASAPGRGQMVTRILLVSPCNEAVKAGRIPSHRLRGLKVEDNAPPATIAWATKESLAALADALGDYGLLVWTGRLCGLRLGESLGLRKGDFIQGGTVLRLSRQRVADGTIGPLKARRDGEYRDIPIPPALWAMVRDLPDGDLFKPCYQANIHQRVRRARDRAGLPGKFTCHDLRHMYASDLLGEGIPITDVAHFLGHSDIKITFATYGHLVPSAFGRAREVFKDW